MVTLLISPINDGSRQTALLVKNGLKGLFVAAGYVLNLRTLTLAWLLLGAVGVVSEVAGVARSGSRAP